MEPDYARAFRIIRAAFGLKQSELAARMDVSVSQLSLIEAGKRNATDKVITALASAVKVPVDLVSLLAASSDEISGASSRSMASKATILLNLLVPEQRRPRSSRARKIA